MEAIKDSLDTIDLKAFKLMDIKSRKNIIRGLNAKDMKKLCRLLNIRDDSHSTDLMNRLVNYHF